MTYNSFLHTSAHAHFEIEMYSTIVDVPKDVWDKIVGSHFYASVDHLEVIEKVQSNDIKFFYVLVKRSEEYIAALYFQYLNFSMANAVNSWQNKNEQKYSVIYPFIRLAKGKVLPLVQSGNVFSTEDNGLYFIENICEEEKTEVLDQVIQFLTIQIKGGKKTYFMLSGFLNKIQNPVAVLEGFHPLEIEPNLILKIKPNWHTFEDYTMQMSSKYRQRVKKVMSCTTELDIRDIELDELILLEDQIIHLYQQVARHASFNMAELSKGYFVEYKKMYGKDFVVKAYYLHEKLVGFTSSFFTSTYQYVHFIGMDYDVNEQLPLYHRMLFEFVRESIQQQHTQIFLGRTATEIKTTIGAEPVEMVNYIKVQSAWYKCVLPKVLNRFGAKPYIVRSPFKQMDQVVAEV